jgi:hypothetical protein
MTKQTQQSDSETHNTEGIIERKGTRLGILSAGTHHENAEEHLVMLRWAKCSCSIGIFFLYFDNHAK